MKRIYSFIRPLSTKLRTRVIVSKLLFLTLLNSTALFAAQPATSVTFKAPDYSILFSSGQDACDYEYYNAILPWVPSSGPYVFNPPSKCIRSIPAPALFDLTVTTKCPVGESLIDYQTCTTSPITNPKYNPDSTSQVNGICESTNNSISFNVGNEVIRETDYFGFGPVFPIFKRTYNSISSVTLEKLGPQWRSSLGRSILLLNNVAYAYRSGGKMYSFSPVSNTWIPESDIADKLIEIKDGSGVRTGWTFTTDSTGEIETYDVMGKLLSITDRAGNTQSLTYYTNNKVAAITDLFGHKLSFIYDTSNRITNMTNPAGGVYTYAYDANGNLASVTYPDGKVKTYLYGSTAGESGNVSSTPEAGVVYTNSLTGVIDENGDRYATYIYDSKGRATSEYLAGNADAASLVFNTDGSGNPTTTQVTDSRGNVNTYNFTTILGVVKSTGQSQPAGAGCAASASAITYDANGNVASRTDFNGNMTTFSYDMARNLETRRTEGLNAAGNATPATRTITTTWHPTWRLPLVTSEFSGATATGTAIRRTTNVYDAKGNLTSIAEADPVRSLTRTTTITYTYSSLVPGLVLSKVVNGPRTDATDTTTYNYYDANATCTPSSAAPLIDPITNTSPPNLGCRGQLQSVTNALGQTTTYDRYNHHGQVEQMMDANGLVTTNTYDLRQRLLSRTVGTQTTSLTYDNAGQVIQLTMPDNSQLNYTYDAAHRLTEVQDTLGNKVTYTLDSEGNLINEVTTDPLGNLAKTITRSYDALNRLQQVTGVE